MPPKIKITKEEIIKTGLDLIRESGEDAINARTIASALGSSTQPIFSNFDSMEDLHAQIITAAYDLYLSFIKNEIQSEKYPPYKAYGMAYIRFAKEEKQLFKLLFMCDRTGESFIPKEDFNVSVEMIMKMTGMGREAATLLHLEMWTCVHGIGTMLATSFLELDFELISSIISDIYHGLRTRHITEAK